MEVYNDNTLMHNINQNLSLYIPSVNSEYANFQYFYSVFNSLNIGLVKRVDFQPKEGTTTYMAFVHMVRWYENEAVMNLQEKVLSQEPNVHEARIVHNDPEFWVLKHNKNPIPDNYPEELSQLKVNMCTLMNLVNKQYETIHSLNNKIESLQYWIKLHDANIKYLCDTVSEMKENSYYNLESRVCKRKTNLDYSSC